MGNNLTTNGIVRIDRGRIVFFDRSIESQASKAELEMASTAAAAGEEEAEVTGTHIEQLPNDLWIEIMSYLSYLDLQQLRLVSWRCRDLVNRRYFLNKAKVIVTKENLKEMKSHVERGISYLSFEYLELRNLTQSKDLEQFLRMVGPEVKDMQVRHSPVFRNMDGKLPNLKILRIATTSFLEDTSVSIDGINMKQFLHLNGFECDGVSLDSSLKLLMLMQLRRMENKVRLRHLQFEYRRNNESALLQVLYDHAATLECVDIFFSCSPGIDTTDWCLAFEQMNRLRTLKLSGNCHLVLLDDILDSIPETAQLQQLDLTGMLSLTNEMLLRVASKWHNTLRSLDLMFCVQLDVRCVQALRQLSGCLQSLTMAYCRALTGRGLVEGLTSQTNYMLQELYLEDVCFIDEASMCTMLKRLPNLRKLSLDNCRQATTDQTLATIFQHQTLLRVLRIDYCVKITDNGFIGFGKQPFPISRLRGLRKLSIRGCRNITDRMLKKALQMPEMLSLTLDYCNRLETKGIAAVSVNCPALQMISLASCSLLDDEAVHLAVSNLKRLRSLNISNCSLLTLRAFQHIAKEARNLRDLVACSIDGLDHEAAQKMLAKELPELKQVML
ncbi:F-box and leucine-rich repeat protein 13 [Drosophila nasuta]|uniref:F-box and leucine-rich repeat protein 13 n=1 Tax=Drosophila nasuta TaxID=42062 RepID=UPI00295EB70B|nr:F-box and leucine-rich repeat protein 13 [Drosophila nasuta]